MAAGLLREYIINLEQRAFHVIAAGSCIPSGFHVFRASMLLLTAHSQPHFPSSVQAPIRWAPTTCGIAFMTANCLAGSTFWLDESKTYHLKDVFQKFAVKTC